MQANRTTVYVVTETETYDIRNPPTDGLKTRVIAICLSHDDAQTLMNAGPNRGYESCRADRVPALNSIS